MANPELFKKLKGKMPPMAKDEMLDTADFEMEAAPEEEMAEEEMEAAPNEDLAAISDEDLLAEIEARGLSASKPLPKPKF
jgi:hypothetical protein